MSEEIMQNNMENEEELTLEKFNEKNHKIKETYNLAVAKTHIINNGKKSVFITLLIGGLNASNPQSFMDYVVSEFVGKRMYNEYVDANLDNPWLRIIIEDINDLL